MKKTIFTLLILALVGQMAAQQNDKKIRETVAIGIRGGYSYPQNASLNDLAYDELMNRIRPVFGLNVEIPLFNGHMYVAPEVAFTGRGDSRLFESASYDTLVRYQAKVNYLEARLPISVAFPAASWLKPYVFAAPSFGLVLDTVGPFRSEIRQYSLDGALNDSVGVSTSNMAPYDYGVTLGAGLRFRLNFQSFAMLIKVEGGYHLGLRDTYNIKAPRLNRGIEGSVTIAIPLDFHSADDCFYWSDIHQRKNKNRGLYGF